MTRPRNTPLPRTKSLDYLAVEISWGSRWINLNDGATYRISAQGTRDTGARNWKKTTVESPVLAGNYLVHAVPDMMTQQVMVWVHGDSQTELGENYHTLLDLFSQWSYRLRWTLDEYQETWNCQLADASVSRNHVWTHSLMAAATFTVPVYPDVERVSFE